MAFSLRAAPHRPLPVDIPSFPARVKIFFCFEESIGTNGRLFSRKMTLTDREFSADPEAQ
jgi:hypothetical protein